MRAFQVNSLPLDYTQAWGDTATNNNGFITTCTNGMNDGVWFKFKGTGGYTIVEIPAGQLSNDAEIAVYSGSCSSFTCIGNSDSTGVGGPEIVQFYSNLNEDYYVNVGHPSASIDALEGNFQLKIGGFLPNDTCSGATAITTTPFTFIENNGALATQTSFTPSCGGNDGEWFKFISNGSNLTIDVTNVQSGYDPKITVFNGTNYDNLVCNFTVDSGNAGQAETLSMNTISGQLYFINVGQYSTTINNNEGNFTITVNGGVLANENFEFKNLKIYPNPVTNILNIENSEKIDFISISNLLGQEILHQKNNDLKTQIDLSSFQNGAYFVKVNSENKEQIFKILKTN